MEKGIFKNLQFVQLKGEKIEGFGVIADFDDKIAYMMLVDMDDRFGCWEKELDKLEEVSEEFIREQLAEISKRREDFPYFIIQLNDIKELSQYHIEEDDFIKNIRNTNEVCLYWEEVKFIENITKNIGNVKVDNLATKFIGYDYWTNALNIEDCLEKAYKEKSQEELREFNHELLELINS